MRSFKAGNIFGITIELHWTLLLLPLFVLILTGGVDQALPFIILLLFLFPSVLLHELTHSVVSIKRGVKVNRILLLPIGGIAFAEEMPENAVDEFLISISGPLFNFFVVFAVSASVLFLGLPFPIDFFESELASGEINEKISLALVNYPLFALFYVNLILGMFNLFVPALPLDGGRVLRSLLGMRMSHYKATKIATTISIVLSIFLFVLSFLTVYVILMFISLFILFAAKEEKNFAETKHIFRNTLLSELIEKKPVILKESVLTETAIKILFSKKKTAALVEFENRDFGVFDLSELPQETSKKAPVAFYSKKIAPVDINMPVSKLLGLFSAKGVSLMPVQNKGVFAGAVSLEHLEKSRNLIKIKDSLNLKDE